MEANQGMEPSLIIFIGGVIILCLVALIYKCCESLHGSQHGSQYGSKHGPQFQTPYRQMPTFQNESTRRFDRSSPSIDLHGYSVARAKDEVDEFLRRCTINYTRGGRDADRYVYIVTGRGLHSPSGYPAIKEAVQDYLNARSYRYEWNNDGEAEVDLRGW
ncbi:unnamed protein product [Lymnaea stagnalis]|uniref:Smr domain-containing protein n=1 Tax=Lymnaea stagnalis TaxID=6523 RepID=A0AAV2HYV3_LYMST